MKNAEQKRGFDKGMTLANGNTYMYDSSRRIMELAAKDPEYAAASVDYKSGFANAVYSLFRC